MYYAPKLLRYPDWSGSKFSCPDQSGHSRFAVYPDSDSDGGALVTGFSSLVTARQRFGVGIEKRCANAAVPVVRFQRQPPGSQ